MDLHVCCKAQSDPTPLLRSVVNVWSAWCLWRCPPTTTAMNDFLFLLWNLVLPSSCLLTLLKALGTRNINNSSSSSSSATIDLSSIKSGIFSGRLGPPPGLRKYPDTPVLSPSQAKALLSSLSSSGLNAEALLLSSTLRQYHTLREQRASSLGLSSPPSSTTPSPTSATPSLSPSSPTSLSLSAVTDHKPSSRLVSFGFNGRSGAENVAKDLSPSE